MSYKFRLKSILAFALLITVATLHAETKVVERSAKNIPAWVGVSEPDFLIVSVQGESLEQARSLALQKITEEILKSIAANVELVQHSEISESNRNGDIESLEFFSQKFNVNTVRLPYLKDITLAKAADIYWEKRMDKNSKEEFYNYEVKYPFPAAERSRLIREFEEYDSGKTARLNELESRLSEIDSLDGIKQSLGEIEVLQEYFFDSQRLSQAKNLQKRYKELYKAVTIQGEFVSPGVLECGLFLNGRPFTVPAIGNVKSSCARILSTVPYGKAFRITYNAEDCLPDEINTITVTFRAGERKIEHKFEIPL